MTHLPFICWQGRPVWVWLQMTANMFDADHFQRVRPPNVLLTTCYKPSGIMYKFLAEMLEVLPCATYYKRQVSGSGLCACDFV